MRSLRKIRVNLYHRAPLSYMYFSEILGRMVRMVGFAISTGSPASPGSNIRHALYFGCRIYGSTQAKKKTEFPAF